MSQLRFTIFFCCMAAVLSHLPAAAQTTNIDAANNTLLLARSLEMEASLKSIDKSAGKEMQDSFNEKIQSDKLLEQTLQRFYDCAPCLDRRMIDWTALRTAIAGAWTVIARNGNDSIYKKITKKVYDRMFTLPEAADMPGDVVWRKYKDVFIRAEKAFLGTSRMDGIRDIFDVAAGVTNGELSAIKGTVSQIAGSGSSEGILQEGYLASETLSKGFRDEVDGIIEDVRQMSNSWVPSADKDLYYQEKLKELNRLFADVKGMNWVDYILETEKTDRMNINEEVKKITERR